MISTISAQSRRNIDIPKYGRLGGEVRVVAEKGRPRIQEFSFLHLVLQSLYKERPYRKVCKNGVQDSGWELMAEQASVKWGRIDVSGEKLGEFQEVKRLLPDGDNLVLGVDIKPEGAAKTVLSNMEWEIPSSPDL